MKLIISLAFFFTALHSEIRLPFPEEEGEVDFQIQEKEVIPPQTSESLEESLPSSGLPNLPPKKKIKAKDSNQNLNRGAYLRANYHLNRKDETRAVPDYNSASNEEGIANYKSKLELIRLYAKERKIQAAKSLIESLENPEQKFEAYFELAMGLHNSAKTKEEKEESLAIYLFILTEAPQSQEKANPILPKTSWAIGNLLFQLEDYLPALDHLSKIILEFKDSEYYDDAIYLSGRIYEEGKVPEVKDLERAKKYYEIFLSQKHRSPFKESIYLGEVEKRYKKISSKF